MTLTSSVPAILLRRNLRLLNVFSALLGLSFLSPLWVLHVRHSLADHATLTNTVLAAQALACCVVELPAGVMADLVGRQQCLVGCALLRLFGVLLLATLETYMEQIGSNLRLAAFLAVAICEGGSQALSSGADVALLHDSLVALGRDDEFSEQLSTRGIIWPLSAAVANLMGAALADAMGLQACVFATGVVSILALVTAMLMHEVFPRMYAIHRVRRKLAEEKQQREEQSASATPPVAADSNSGQDQPAAAMPDSTMNLRSRKRSPSLTIVQPAAAATTTTSDCNGAESLASRAPCTSPYASLPPPSCSHFSFVLRQHIEQCISTLRSSPTLQGIMLWSALLFGFSEPAHRVRSVFLTARGFPPSQLGIIGAATFALSAMGAFITAKHKKQQQKLEQQQQQRQQHQILPLPPLAPRRWMFLGGERGILLLSCVLPPCLQFLSATSSFQNHPTMSALLLLPGSLLWGMRVPILAASMHAALPAGATAAAESDVDHGAGISLFSPPPAAAVASPVPSVGIDDSPISSSAPAAAASPSISAPHCNHRATVSSLQSLLNKLSLSLVLTLFAGPLQDAWGIDTTIQTMAILAIIPVWPLATFMNRKNNMQKQLQQQQQQQQQQTDAASTATSKQTAVSAAATARSQRKPFHNE